MVQNIGRRNKQRGAEFEREIADLFDGKRAGTKGLPDEEHEDIIIDGFRIQCKRRKVLSLSSDWWHHVSDEAKLRGQVPLLVTREDRGDPLVVMKVSHFLSIMKSAKHRVEEERWIEFLKVLSSQ